MINLLTGVPGAGKTLYMCSKVEARRIRENRVVYYHGMTDVKLDWVLISEPQKWYELPDGAIIVFDEAQQVFPKRATGSAVPVWESKFETHRHKGHDVYLTTQDPSFLDSHLRKLVQTHLHFMRKFGTKWTTVHQFETCRDNVSKTRKDSIESQWVNDSAMYGKYKSASIHTQKVRVPTKLWLAVLLPFFIIGMAWYFYQRRMVPQPAAVPVASSTAGVSSVTQSAQPVKKTYDLAAFVPRIPGLPHTAPRYDELTVPVRVPTIVGCVTGKGRSFCYTQQGTRIYPQASFIAQFMENGMFEDHERGPELGSTQRANAQPSASASPEQLTPLGRAKQAQMAAKPSPFIEGAESMPSEVGMSSQATVWNISDASNLRQTLHSSTSRTPVSK